MPAIVYEKCIPGQNPDGTIKRNPETLLPMGGHEDECQIANRTSSLWRRFWAGRICRCPCHGLSRAEWKRFEWNADTFLRWASKQERLDD